MMKSDESVVHTVNSQERSASEVADLLLAEWVDHRHFEDISSCGFHPTFDEPILEWLETAN